MDSGEKFIPSEEDLLNVLVQATKDAINLAKQKWVELSNYFKSPSMAKVAIMLNDGLPVAAAKNMLIIAYDNDTYLNRVNSKDNHEMMNNFLKAVYKDNMMVYCVTKAEFVKLRDKFLVLKNAGNLPEPRKLDFEKVENKFDKGLEFGKKIFGDFLKVKEE